MINRNCYKAWISIFIILTVAVYHSAAQPNIVQNPGFEEYTECPIQIGDGDLECDPWQNGNCATADYYHVCAGDPDVGVPSNWVGYQSPHGGEAYLGFICKWGNPDWQEFPQVMLKEACIPGYSYEFEFYISLANTFCGIEHIGILFSKEPPPDPTYCGPLDALPQFETNQGFLSDTFGWTAIRGCFVAQGGELWMTIGNFHTQDDTPLDPDCTVSLNSYYLIDDVSVTIKEEVEEFNFDLGDPVEICDEYLIDPGIDNMLYLWSDGSRDPTLLVTETGTYSLTLTEPGCKSYAIDSIEVTILGVPDTVEIGPAEVIFCEGESYEIILDPNIGEYEWQDGSDDTEYTITTSGTYSVTFDDGCDESVDEVIVTVVSPPAPFTLGPDEYLCPGEQINFSFDPALGDFLWQDDTTNPFYTISTEDSYALTISNMCGEFSDEIEVEDLEPPTLDIDDPIILCDGTPVTIDPGPDQGDYMWQDGSDEIEFETETPGTFYVTVTNECGVANDSALVVLVQEPILYLGPDQYLCPSQFPFLIHPGDVPHAEEYIWGDGSSEDSLWVETPGIYYLTVSNECFNIPDVIEIFLEGEVPVVTLPPDQVLCPGQTFLLTSNIQAGTFLWQDGSTNSSLNVQSPGTYYLAVTNDCGTGTDTVMIDYITPLPVPDLGPDLSLCPGEQITLTTSIENVNYVWQDGSTNDSLLVNTPGTYSIQISDQCTSNTDTIVVQGNNLPPQVNLPDTLSICQGDSTIINAGVTGVSYLWNDGSKNAQLIVYTPGTYSLTVDNACGTDEDTVVVIDNGVAPTVFLGNDVSFCPGENMLLTPVSSGVNSWLWQDGSTNASILITSAGEYVVTVSNLCGIAQDTLQATLLPATPTFELGPDTALCPGFSYTLQIEVTGVDILWSDGSTTPELVATMPGFISAMITNGCGEENDTVEISALPPAPVLNLGLDQSLCIGETIIVDPGLNNVDYLWQDGTASSTYQSTQEETIILTVSNDCGADTDTLEITESTEGPQVDLGLDITGCAGDTVILSSNISGVDYEWNDGSTHNQLQVLQSGTYSIAVSNLCGSDMDTVIVDLSGLPPAVALGADTSVCEGAILILAATVSSGAQITWQDGSHTFGYQVIDEGIYWVVGSNVCGEDTDSLIVTYQYPPEAFTLGPDTVLCPDEFITLTVPLTGYDILWQNGSQQSSIIADQDGIYLLTLSNHCGSVSDDIEVSLDQRTPVIRLEANYEWCEGDEITLNVLQPFPATYLWSDGSTGSAITISTPGIYTVEVSTECQTISEDITVISVEPCKPQVVIKDDIYIPNVFSPNDDGINDLFTPLFGSDLQVIQLSGSVYDRWGSELYATEGSTFSWDGRFKGETLNPGVYVYTILVNYKFNGRDYEERFSGDVTLVR